MKLAPSLARRTAAAALAAATALGAAGCSAVNYQATTHDYSASNGIVQNVGEGDFRHIMLVTSGEGEPARLIGSISNEAEQPLEASVEIGGTSFSVTVPAGGMVSLQETEKFIVDSAPVAPGGVTPVTLTAGDVTETAEATVLDGVYSQYRHLVPGGWQNSVTEHLEHGPDTYGAGAAYHAGGGHGGESGGESGGHGGEESGSGEEQSGH